MENTRIDIGLAVLRIVTGFTFAAHGAQKLFQYGIAGLTGSFEGMGIPLAAFAAPLVTGIELIGGIALVAGMFTRATGVATALTMLGAIVFAHLGGGFFAPAGVELPLMLMTASLSLAIMGPGAWSVASLAKRDGAVASTARA